MWSKSPRHEEQASGNHSGWPMMWGKRGGHRPSRGSRRDERAKTSPARLASSRLAASGSGTYAGRDSMAPSSPPGSPRRSTAASSTASGAGPHRLGSSGSGSYAEHMGSMSEQGPPNSGSMHVMSTSSNGIAALGSMGRASTASNSRSPNGSTLASSAMQRSSVASTGYHDRYLQQQLADVQETGSGALPKKSFRGIAANSVASTVMSNSSANTYNRSPADSFAFSDAVQQEAASTLANEQPRPARRVSFMGDNEGAGMEAPMIPDPRAGAPIPFIPSMQSKAAPVTAASTMHISSAHQHTYTATSSAATAGSQLVTGPSSGQSTHAAPATPLNGTRSAATVVGGAWGSISNNTSPSDLHGSQESHIGSQGTAIHAMTVFEGRHMADLPMPEGSRAGAAAVAGSMQHGGGSSSFSEGAASLRLVQHQLQERDAMLVAALQELELSQQLQLQRDELAQMRVQVRHASEQRQQTVTELQQTVQALGTMQKQGQSDPVVTQLQMHVVQLEGAAEQLGYQLQQRQQELEEAVNKLQQREQQMVQLQQREGTVPRLLQELGEVQRKLVQREVELAAARRQLGSVGSSSTEQQLRQADEDLAMVMATLQQQREQQDRAMEETAEQLRHLQQQLKQREEELEVLMASQQQQRDTSGFMGNGSSPNLMDTMHEVLTAAAAAGIDVVSAAAAAAGGTGTLQLPGSSPAAPGGGAAPKEATLLSMVAGAAKRSTIALSSRSSVVRSRAGSLAQFQEGGAAAHTQEASMFNLGNLHEHSAMGVSAAKHQPSGVELWEVSEGQADVTPHRSPSPGFGGAPYSNGAPVPAPRSDISAISGGSDLSGPGGALAWRETLAREREARHMLKVELEHTRAELTAAQGLSSMADHMRGNMVKEALAKAAAAEARIALLQQRLADAESRAAAAEGDNASQRSTSICIASRAEADADSSRRLRLQLTATEGSVTVLTQQLAAAKAELAAALKGLDEKEEEARKLSWQLQQQGMESRDGNRESSNQVDFQARKHLANLMEIRNHPLLLVPEQPDISALQQHQQVARPLHIPSMHKHLRTSQRALDRAASQLLQLPGSSEFDRHHLQASDAAPLTATPATAELQFLTGGVTEGFGSVSQDFGTAGGPPTEQYSSTANQQYTDNANVMYQGAFAGSEEPLLTNSVAQSVAFFESVSGADSAGRRLQGTSSGASGKRETSNHHTDHLGSLSGGRGSGAAGNGDPAQSTSLAGTIQHSSKSSMSYRDSFALSPLAAPELEQKLGSSFFLPGTGEEAGAGSFLLPGSDEQQQQQEQEQQGDFIDAWWGNQQEEQGRDSSSMAFHHEVVQQQQWQLPGGSAASSPHASIFGAADALPGLPVLLEDTARFGRVSKVGPGVMDGWGPGMQEGQHGLPGGQVYNNPLWAEQQPW